MKCQKAADSLSSKRGSGFLRGKVFLEDGVDPVVPASSMVGGILGTIAYTFFLARVLAQCREELTSSGRLAWLENPWIASVVIPILLAVLGVVLQQVPEA